VTDNYSVTYTGRLRPGVGLEEAVAAFAARFRVHPQRVRGMLEGGEMVVKAGLDAAGAREYRQALERIGLEVRVDPAVALVPAGGGGGGVPIEPGNALHEPRGVPPGRGWRWLRQGMSMVFTSPVHWIGAVLVWMVVNLALGLIPLANVLSALLAPVFMGGVMLGAHEQQEGGGFRIERLFAGFGRRTGPLLLVGVLYMLGFILIGVLMFVLLGGLFALTPSTPGAGSPPVPDWTAWLAALAVLGLTIPLLMAYWFAPALVILDGMPALRAMANSFRGCLRNILPLAVYGLIALVLLFLGALPLLLGLLVVMPVLVAAIYVSYRDIFRG
jgi:uncharacterized membrane protein